MPNFVKEYDENDDPDEISGIDKWIYVLKHLSKLKALPKFLDKRIFTKLFQIAEIGNLNTDDMRTYEASLKAKRDYYSAMSYTQKQAKEEGEIEGKIKIIKNLITEFGFTDQQAAQAAKVSIDFVENIRKELNK